MVALLWDRTGERLYETGVSKGVLFQVDNAGEYVDGVAWNGLTAVTESPGGAEANPFYADNIKYLNLVSAEEFMGTIEAFTYPLAFGQNDGSASPTPGVMVGQQGRKTFGFCWQTLIGNDLEGTDHGFKLHLVYGALAAPSEKAYTTVNDSPEPMTLSWEVSTTPVPVGTVDGMTFKPTSKLTIDSTQVDEDKLNTLLDTLYGTPGTDPAMPLPADVIAMMGVVLVEAVPTAPAYNAGTHTITIPAVTGVVYKINGVTKPAGDVIIAVDTIVKAYPITGYKFPAVIDNDWLYEF
jgi:hypothetical protein